MLLMLQVPLWAWACFFRLQLQAHLNVLCQWQQLHVSCAFFIGVACGYVVDILNSYAQLISCLDD